MDLNGNNLKDYKVEVKTPNIAPASIKDFSHRQAGVPKYVAGAARSVGRLKALKFDPIGELVTKYRQLEDEVERQKLIRDGVIVELTSAGKPRSYRPEVHHALFDKQISIGEKLLRYAYGRVPDEGIETPKTPMPLIVNLTKKGETYIANESADTEDFDAYDDADTHE
jgi:hypothetical protein